MANLGKLESMIGHKFKDLSLLERAVTHRSWAHENLPGAGDEELRCAENESMEFLGDSVLGSIIAELLYRDAPSRSEGDLTLMKHHLVSTATLATIAERLDLGAFMKVGRGEEKTGGRKKHALLADTLEALIAAIFLDAGYPAARVAVGRIFADELRDADPGRSVDYKSALQEVLQAEGGPAPAYSVLETEGPPHAREFLVETTWSTGKAQGRGPSIKAAEMMAAAEALKILRAIEQPGAKQARSEGRMM
jgi:ribonuclease III